MDHGLKNGNGRRTRGGAPLLAAVAFALALAGPSVGRAAELTSPLPDSVERFRRLLYELRQATASAFSDKPPEEMAALRKSVKSEAERLTRVGDLRLALTLPDWGLETEKDPKIDANLLDVRQDIAVRLATKLRHSLAKGAEIDRLAAVKLIGEMGYTEVILKDERRVSYTRQFTKDLLPLLGAGTPDRLRTATARALGRITPDQPGTASAIAALLGSSDSAVRRAAADGLGDMLLTFIDITRKSGLGVAPLPEKEIIPELGRMLGDSDPSIRKKALEALVQTTDALYAAEAGTDPGRLNVARIRAGLEVQQPAVLTLLKNGTRDERRQAARIVENLNWLRGRKPPPLAVPGVPVGRRLAAAPETAGVDDPTAEAIQALVEQLGDPDKQVRLTVVQALEALGVRARPAAPALASVLRDRYPFVRLAAARTLGAMAPRADGDKPLSESSLKLRQALADQVVPGLAGLLPDTDIDVRMEALRALEAYKTDAHAAVPAICRAALRGDGDPRALAIRVLEEVRTDDEKATARATLIAALAADDERVRREAVVALARYGPSVLPALEKMLDDPDSGVSQAASSSILAITEK